MSKKQIIIMNEGIAFDVKDKNDCVKAIIEEYNRSDVCIHELLSTIEIQGFSAEDVVYIYANCMNTIEGDILVHIREPKILDYTKHEFLGGIV